MRIKYLVLYVATALLLNGCDADSSFSQLGQEWNALKIVLTGGTSPLAKNPEPKESTRTLPASEAGAHAKQNRELLEEVLTVVYNHRPTNAAEFGNLADTLNQGASIEGLYNGFTHSSDYRQLEIADPTSTNAALRFFVSELAQTEVALHVETEFNHNSKQPLGMAVEPTGTEAAVNEVVYPAPGSESGTPPASSPSPAVTKPSAQALEGKYIDIFTGASIFTLKRVLGDEMLKLVAEKSLENSPENGKGSKALQAWYGPWVVRMASKNIDFGLPLRNKADLAFHTDYAATADPDHLKWEVLNRVHRALNFLDTTPAVQPSVKPSSGSIPTAAAP